MPTFLVEPAEYFVSRGRLLTLRVKLRKIVQSYSPKKWLRKGGDTTTRTGIETAGSGKDLGFGFGPSEPAAASSTLRYLRAAPVTRSLSSHRRGAARPSRK